MSETALVRTSGFDEAQTQALAALGFGSDDIMRPAKLALVQPIECDGENGKVGGTFLDIKSKQVFRKMRVVPLAFYAGRVLFAGEELGSKPLCRSSNGVLPVINDDIVRQDGGLGCKKCPKSQWKKIGSKSIKPQCSETLAFVFVDEETGFPYKLNAKGVNLSPLKDLRDTLRKELMMRVAKKQPVPLYGFAVDMAATKVQGKKGTYYILDFSAPTVIEDPTEFGPVFEALVVRKGGEAEDPEPTGETAVNQAIDAEYVEA